MTGNATIIELPQVGESVTEGTIVQWLKGVGDHVDRYDPLVEVLTDKVSMEVPSPVAGVITELLAEEGQTLPMGAPIASIQTEVAVESHAPNRTTPAAPTEEPQNIDRTGVLLKDVAPVGPTGSGNVLFPPRRMQQRQNKRDAADNADVTRPQCSDSLTNTASTSRKYRALESAGVSRARMCLHTPKLGHSPQSLKRLPPLCLRFRLYRLPQTKSACRCLPCAE